MKRERTLEAKIVKTRNELVDCLEREDIVIFVEGDLYEKMKEELGDPKMNKTVGKVGLGVGMLALSPISIGLGLGFLLLGTAKDQIKKYNFKNNKELERVELYLVKGEKRYNKELDTISNYDKDRYEYEEWWENWEEEKVYKRDEMKFASDRLREAEEHAKDPKTSSWLTPFDNLHRTLDYFNQKSKNK